MTVLFPQAANAKNISGASLPAPPSPPLETQDVPEFTSAGTAFLRDTSHGFEPVVAGNQIIRLATSANELDAAQALRYRIFYDEMGAHPLPEMAATRRVLERVPGDKGTWKPHEKSFSLAHLAQLVAWMPGWIPRTLHDPHIDLASSAGYTNEKTDTLLQMFDKGVADARKALEAVTGEALEEPWSLKHGERVLMTMPRGETVRQHISHLVHHRGQLTVYLRLLDVPVPSTYGPTADEKWG